MCFGPGRGLDGMVLFSMGVSVDGYVADRDGEFAWTKPSDELFRFHTERVAQLGAILLGRRLYETMRVWETDPAMRADPAGARFADLWAALPKVVFSRTLHCVDGNARLARGPVAEEVAAVREATGRDVEIGGPTLAAQAFELGLVDELRLFRYPVVVGGGTPALLPLARRVLLELVETRTFPGQVVYERYRRV